MATIAKLVAELSLDNNAFLRGIDNARGGLDSLGEKSRNAGRSLTGWVTTPLLGLGAAAISAGSTVENAIGKTEAVFGSSADTVVAWSTTTADAFGVWRGEALQSAGNYGALFKLMGQTDQMAAQYSTTLVGLAADMAAFNDVSTSRASEAIQSGLTGEYESLKSMGVFLNETIVAEEALAIAMADGRTEVTEADKVMARYNLILEQTTQQQGQAAREANSFNGRLTRTIAKLRNLAASFGSRLLGPAGAFLDFLQGWLDKLGQLSPKMQAWIIGIAAAAAALGPLLIVIGMMLPGLSALLAIVAALLSPIGLIIAAVGLLAYLFRDELGAALDWVIQKVDIFIGTWQQLRTMGLDPVQAALAALQLMFPQLGAVLGQLRGMVDNLVDAFNAFRDGDYALAFSELWEAVKNLGSAFLALGQAAWDALASIDWAGIAAAVGGWLGEQLAAIKWGSVLATLGSLALTLDQKIREAVNAINWAGIGEAVGAATADILRAAAGLMVDGFREVASDPVKWGMIALAIATSIITIPILLGAWIGDVMRGPAADFIGGFLVGLNLNWIQIAVWLAALPGRILAGIGSLAATLLAKGMELLAGLKAGIDFGWLAVQGWLVALPARALAAVTSMATTLLARGTELMAGLRAGILAGWEAARVWLASLPTLIKTTIGSLTSTLLQKGKDLFTGLFTGILEVWQLIANFLRTMQTLVIGFFAGAVTWLIASGRSTMTGFYSGLLSGWESARSWLSGIGGRAISAVGSLGSKLYSAGRSLIQGLIDGINSMLGTLTSTLGSVTSLIPSWKGPPEKDAKLLVNNGRLIMGGLMAGLDDGWDDVKHQLQGYTPAMSSLVDGDAIGGGASGRGQVIQIITLEPGKWAEFLADAQTGGTFARQFGGEVAMRGGQP